MTIDAGGEAATTTEGASEVADRDYEAEARSEGWVPEEEFRGTKKPAKFLSAQEFVERGEMFAPFKSRTEKMVEERVGKMEKVYQRTIQMIEQQHAKEMAGLKAEKKAAIKAGDEELVEEIEAKIDDLKEKKSDTAEKVAKAYDDFDENYAPKTQEDPDFKVLKAGFFKANPWMIDEPEMAAYATEVSALNAEANPDIGFKANMKYVLERVKKKFPAYFADDKAAAANGHAAVDAGGAFSGSTRTKKTFSDLPKEAQQAYERFDPRVKARISKEQYTKEYLADA